MFLTRLLPHLTAARLARAMPSQCRVCHAWPARPLCMACVARFAPATHRCHTCALPVPPGVVQCGTCLREPPPFAQCLAAVDYAWPWTHCIAQLKFAQDTGLAAPLAALLAATPGVAQALADADWVLPMPLSPQRLAERGYNPALLLAHALAHAKTRSGVLLRVRHAVPQRDLPRAQRLRNVRGAFAVDPLHASLLRDARVVLLDDVMTTGASLREAARPLQQAGAARITAMVLARTA